MRWNIVIGGPAGQGPNFIANLLSEVLSRKGFYVFASREYESRIRGGHNYNLVTFSDSELYSNSLDIDILVCLDEVSEETHKKELKKGAFVVKGVENNVYAAGAVCKILGIDFNIMDNELKKHPSYEANILEAKKGYDFEKRTISLPKVKINSKVYLMNGNDGVAIGAKESGLDLYYAYPMTPATGVFFSLARDESKNKYVTVQLESEIAVINAAIGSAIAGKKSMVGTSGGGFDLMSESLSLSGGAHVPLVLYLAQRPGPATGAATYTSQGDLNIARHGGHGEFIRVLAVPGDPIEAEELTSQMFYLSQKYMIPAILLGDKHLADSFFSLKDKAKITKSQNGVKWPARFSSYEVNDEIIADSSAKSIINSVERRREKYQKICAEIEKMESFKIHGKKDSKTLVIGWGSTKGAIIDSISGLNCKYVQPLFIEPFSNKLANEIKKAKKIIVVENNSTSIISEIIAEKTGMLIENKNKILKYDGRPFDFESLNKEIKKRVGK